MEQKSKTPFIGTDNVEQLGMYTYKLTDNPNAVIKEVHSHSFNRSRSDSITATHEALVKSRKLFDELQSEFKINHSGFIPFLGENEQKDVATGYILTNYIDGFHYEPNHDGEKPAEIKSEHLPAARILFHKLSEYLTTKVSKDEDFLDDIFSIDQYVYTDPTEENPDGEFVLVDVDTPDYDPDIPEPSTLYASQNLTKLAQSVLNENEYSEWSTEFTQQVNSFLN